MGDNPSEFQDDRRPVESVSWEECQVFLGKLADGKKKLFPKLPSEFEWEYACRAGTRTATWLGDLEIRGANDAPMLEDIAWYGGNSGVGYDQKKGYDSSDWEEKQYPHKQAGTRRVATKAPNPWGLYDMLGNAYEWTSTKWRRGEDDGALRVIRGGSWSSSARYVRAAFHVWSHPGDRARNLGFRLSLGREQSAEPGSRRPGPEGVAERGTSGRAPGRDSGGGGLR